MMDIMEKSMKLIMSMRNLVVESFVAQVVDEKDNAFDRGGVGGLFFLRRFWVVGVIWNLRISDEIEMGVGWSDGRMKKRKRKRSDVYAIMQYITIPS